MKTATFDEERFFLIIVDDCSRFTRCYPLKRKNEAFEKLKIFQTYVQTQTAFRIQTLSSDNDTVFTSEEVEKWCSENGIHHQKSIVYTPQQNGVAERHIRSIKESANSLIQHARMEFNLNVPQLWSLACIYGSAILNHSWKASINTTPTAKAFGHNPELKAFRVWGCFAWAHVHQQQRAGPFEPRRICCHFVGFDLSSKGYLLFNPETKKFLVSNVVTFEEKRPFNQALYAANAFLSDSLQSEEPINLGEVSHRVDPSDDPCVLAEEVSACVLIPDDACRSNEISRSQRIGGSYAIRDIIH